MTSYPITPENLLVRHDQGIRLILKGDKAKAYQYISLARLFQGELKNNISLAKIDSGVRHHTLPDGTVIKNLWDGSLDIIEITVPGAPKEIPPEAKDDFILYPKSDESPFGWRMVDTVYPTEYPGPYEYNVTDKIFASMAVGAHTAVTTVNQSLFCGNQIIFSGTDVYSYWGSPFGDGPFLEYDVTVVGRPTGRYMPYIKRTGTVIFSYAFEMIEYFDPDTGIFYFQDIPHTIYKNGTSFYEVTIDETKNIVGLCLFNPEFHLLVIVTAKGDAAAIYKYTFIGEIFVKLYDIPGDGETVSQMQYRHPFRFNKSSTVVSTITQGITEIIGGYPSKNYFRTLDIGISYDIENDEFTFTPVYGGACFDAISEWIDYTFLGVDTSNNFGFFKASAYKVEDINCPIALSYNEDERILITLEKTISNESLVDSYETGTDGFTSSFSGHSWKKSISEIKRNGEPITVGAVNKFDVDNCSSGENTNWNRTTGAYYLANAFIGDTFTGSKTFLYIDAAKEIYIYRQRSGDYGGTSSSSVQFGSITGTYALTASISQDYIVCHRGIVFNIKHDENEYSSGNVTGGGGESMDGYSEYIYIVEKDGEGNYAVPDDVATTYSNGYFDIDYSLFEMAGNYSIATNKDVSKIIISGAVNSTYEFTIEKSYAGAFGHFILEGLLFYGPQIIGRTGFNFSEIPYSIFVAYINYLNVSELPITSYFRVKSLTDTMEFHPVGKY